MSRKSVAKTDPSGPDPRTPASPVALQKKVAQGNRIPQELFDTENELQWAARIEPQVRRAIEEGKTPDEPFPSPEAWLIVVLYWLERPGTFPQIAEMADSINRRFPTVNDMVWTLGRLRSRGWLLEDGPRIGLNQTGRKVVAQIARFDDYLSPRKITKHLVDALEPGESYRAIPGPVLWERIDALQEWLAKNAP